MSRTSTMLSATVHVRRDPAEQKATHEVHRGPLRVIGPEHEGGIDDHHRQPVGGEAQRLDLRLVLGVHVGDPEMAGPERLALVRGPARPRRADRGDRRRVDDPLHLRGERLFEDDPRALDVELEDRVAVLWRIDVVPARWKTRSTPCIALRTALRSVTSPPMRSISRSERWSRLDPRRSSSRRSSPRSASARTTCEPRKPLPPVTRVLATSNRDGRAVIEGAGEPTAAPPSSPTPRPTCPTS